MIEDKKIVFLIKLLFVVLFILFLTLSFPIFYRVKRIPGYEYIKENGETGVVSECITEKTGRKYCKNAAKAFEVIDYQKVWREK